MPENGGVRGVRSASRTVDLLDRTVDLLEVPAARGDRPARPRELAEELRVPPSSMYALPRTLIERGRVRTDTTCSL